MRRILTCLLLAAVFLTVPASACSVSTLYIRVENVPEEPLYIELLEEDLHKSYISAENASREALAHYDQELLNALLDAVPDGWQAHTLQATRSGYPMYGDLDGEKIDATESLYDFSYDELPNTYRILAVTKSGEIFCSDPFVYRAMGSTVTLDWSAKTITTPRVWLRYILQFLIIFLPTILLKAAILPLFHLWSRQNRKVFFFVNLLTQGTLALWFTIHSCQSGIFWYSYILLAALGTGITAMEILLYILHFENSTKGNTISGTIFANFLSTILVRCFLEPIYHIMILL